MPGKCRPSLRDKTLENVMRSSLSSTDKECIKAVFERYEAEPVKKGRWIEQEAPNMDTYYDCSACGESFCLIDGSPKDNLYTYCPNCGARMDGE